MNNNPLFPIFIKLDQKKILLVGAGNVAYEKLHFLLKSSPNARVTIIAPTQKNKVLSIINSKKFDIQFINKSITFSDIDPYDIIIAATNDPITNHNIYQWAKSKNKWINVVDTPQLCDFYLGSIVTRGDLKIAISTNGKSPTLAKKLRIILEEILPDQTNKIIQNLHHIRSHLQGNFIQKMEKLATITDILIKP